MRLTGCCRNFHICISLGERLPPLEEICFYLDPLYLLEILKFLLDKIRKIIYNNVDGKWVSSWKPSLRICAEMNLKLLPLLSAMPWSMMMLPRSTGWSRLETETESTVTTCSHISLFITFFWSILQSYKWMVLHLFLFLFSFYWCPSTGDMPQYWSVTACMGKNVGNVPYTLWVYTGNTTGVCCLSTNENYFMQMKTTGFACCSLQKLNYCS